MWTFCNISLWRMNFILKLLTCNFVYCSFRDFWNAKLVSYISRSLKRHWHVCSLGMRHLNSFSRQATASKTETVIILVPNKQSQDSRRTEMSTFYIDRKRSMSQLNQDPKKNPLIHGRVILRLEWGQAVEWGRLSVFKEGRSLSQKLSQRTLRKSLVTIDCLSKSPYKSYKYI